MRHAGISGSTPLIPRFKHGRHIDMLQIDLAHTGTDSENPFYACYLRCWVEVVLPPGSNRVRSEPAPEPDPEAPNGSS